MCEQMDFHIMQLLCALLKRKHQNFIFFTSSTLNFLNCTGLTELNESTANINEEGFERRCKDTIPEFSYMEIGEPQKTPHEHQTDLQDLKKVPRHTSLKYYR